MSLRLTSWWLIFFVRNLYIQDPGRGFVSKKGRKKKVTTEETRGSKSCVSPGGKTKGDACGCVANISHALCTHFLSTQTAFTETKYRSFSPLPPARLDPPPRLLPSPIWHYKKKNTHTFSKIAESAAGKTQNKPQERKRKVTKLKRLIRENTAHIRR